MHVVFVEPCFPANQRQFVLALADVGAKVTAIGEHQPDPEIASRLAAFEPVRSVVDEAGLLAAVRRVQGREWVDRLEATVEAHILPVANVRERCGIPGTSVRTAFLCRDKPAMKDALRTAGVPCAQSIGTSSPEEIRDFARKVGYPLIMKPPSAAGAAGTVRIQDQPALENAIKSHHVDRGAPVAVEEFIEGHEGFYDTLSVEGRVVHDFISHYYPGVLEAMRTRSVSPQIVTTNRIADPSYAEVKKLGRKVIEALGIGTSATHMEWFYGPKGLKFSEIGCRPPGVGVWDLYSAANEFDLFREWASVIVHGKAQQQPSRRYSAGMVALRPDKDGVVADYEGVDELNRRFGDCIIDTHFPPTGSPTQPIEAGYMANAWVRMRHPDYDALRGILSWVGENVKVHVR
jgi:formate-dependent phosphoribosylglycinamide formyltransferase (GAR transformylase)